LRKKKYRWIWIRLIRRCTDFCIGKGWEGLAHLKRGLNFPCVKTRTRVFAVSFRNFFSGLPFVFQAKAPALEVGIKGPPVLLSSSSSVLSIHIPFSLFFFPFTPVCSLYVLFTFPFVRKIEVLTDCRRLLS